MDQSRAPKNNWEQGKAAGRENISRSLEQPIEKNLANWNNTATFFPQKVTNVIQSMKFRMNGYYKTWKFDLDLLYHPSAVIRMSNFYISYNRFIYNELTRPAFRQRSQKPRRPEQTLLWRRFVDWNKAL